MVKSPLSASSSSCPFSLAGSEPVDWVMTAFIPPIPPQLPDTSPLLWQTLGRNHEGGRVDFDWWAQVSAVICWLCIFWDCGSRGTCWREHLCRGVQEGRSEAKDGLRQSRIPKYVRPVIYFIHKFPPLSGEAIMLGNSVVGTLGSLQTRRSGSLSGTFHVQTTSVHASRFTLSSSSESRNHRSVSVPLRLVLVSMGTISSTVTGEWGFQLKTTFPTTLPHHLSQRRDLGLASKTIFLIYNVAASSLVIALLYGVELQRKPDWDS